MRPAIPPHRRWLAPVLACLALLGEPRAATSADFDAELEVSAYADTDNVAVLTPSLVGTVSDAASGMRATGDYVVDVVSGASVDIVSTASERWIEVRQAADLAVDYQPRDLGVSLSGGVSREPDYLSWSVGAVARAELDDKHVTPSLGYSFSHDTAGRHGTPYSVYSLELSRHAAQAGVELVLNRSSRLGLLLEGVFETGRQEKPYRFLPLFSADAASRVRPGESIASVNRLRRPGRVAERLPESRQRFTLTADWGLRADESTLRLNERLYADSWGVEASTTDVSWIWDASSRWSLWPRARVHVQSSADFWRLAYVGDVVAGEATVPALRSGDRELSSLWTAALGVGVDFRLEPRPRRGWAFHAVVEASQTRFLEALFLDRRRAGIVVLSVGRPF